jgi:hypothetical protein
MGDWKNWVRGIVAAGIGGAGGAWGDDDLDLDGTGATPSKKRAAAAGVEVEGGHIME